MQTQVESMRVETQTFDNHTVTTFTPEPQAVETALAVRHIADYTGDAARDFEELHAMLFESLELHAMLFESLELDGTLDVGIEELVLLGRAEKALRAALRRLEKLKKTGGLTNG